MTLLSERNMVARLAAGAVRMSNITADEFDPAGLKYVTTISVRAHWLISVICLVELVYRPHYGVIKFAAYAALTAALIGFTAYLHYRLRSNRPVTWRWLLALYGLDILLVSAGTVIGGGFSHDFFHLFYYPVMAAFAVMFTSFRLNMLWVTMVSVVYLGISLTVGDGINLEERDEKALIARIAIMYAVVATVNVASRFERIRWQQSVQRERALERERVEVSRAIHDTAAQSVFLIGMGIDTAKELVGDENPEAVSTLEATSRLSRSTMWELRHQIDMGSIYEGRELGPALRSHVSSFTNVTSVVADMTEMGAEPPLSTEVKSGLFSIAHNALANAYRHAEASRVSIGLEFREQHIRLSVSDDGIGLPDDYAERGHGFTNMRSVAERMGGRLLIEQSGDMGGATITCLVPLER